MCVYASTCADAHVYVHACVVESVELGACGTGGSSRPGRQGVRVADELQLALRAAAVRVCKWVGVGVLQRTLYAAAAAAAAAAGRRGTLALGVTPNGAGGECPSRPQRP